MARYTIKYTDAKFRKPKDNAFSYSQAVIQNDYKSQLTQKQYELIRALEETCNKVEISLDGFKRHPKTNRQASSYIRALYSLLNRYGYDSYGNVLTDTADRKTEPQTEREGK